MSKTEADLLARYTVQQILFHPEAHWNIAPTQIMPVIVVDKDGQRTLDGFKWGLVPSWAKDESIGNKLINARAETVAEKPSYRKALVKRRCLVPASGFFEWQKNGEGKAQTKQPFLIGLEDGGLFSMAGLYEFWKRPDGEWLKTYTILTTQPNDIMAPIHNRMPVILKKDDEDKWLDPSNQDAESLLHMLQPYPATKMKAKKVSTLVNSPKNDTEECIVPLVEEDTRNSA